MGKKRKTRIDLNEGPAKQPLLGEMLRSKGLVPAEPEREEPEPGEVSEGISPDRMDFSGIRSIVLQFEKKGHGGKRATRVSGLPFGTEELDRLARLLRKEMGCGAWVEGETLLLQGNLTDRLRDWFVAKGVRRVVLSGRGGNAG